MKERLLRRFSTNDDELHWRKGGGWDCFRSFRSSNSLL